MADLRQADESMNDLRAEWFRLFAAIERARSSRPDVSDAEITWEIVKLAADVRVGDPVNETTIGALKRAIRRAMSELETDAS